MRIAIHRFVATSVVLVLTAFAPLHATEPEWTLSTSIERVMEVAPELRAASADIGMLRGELTQSSAFPNPSVELRADQKLGIDDGHGGVDLTQIAISQPLPLGRLARQEKMASARLNAAEATLLQQRLLLENRTAHTYHNLQLAQARLDLAEQRLKIIQTYPGQSKHPGDPVVRYLSKNERLRLDILRETARQAVATAEGEYNEALTVFRDQLVLAPDVVPHVPALEPVTPPPGLKILEAHLNSHPALTASQRQLDAAQAGIDVARSQRFADPVVSFFRERDYLGGSRRDYNGVMLSVQVPLWNTNYGGVDRARAESEKVKALYQAQQRELSNRLRLHQMHLGHLIEQAADYDRNLVIPTEQALNLVMKSFAAGQVDLLTLIDANNTHFDAHFRYLELLQMGWSEAADLRLAAGLTEREYHAANATAAPPEKTP